LKIKKILVSQPEPKDGKSPYIELAEKNGFLVEFRPFIKVEGVPSKEFRKQKVNINDFSAVIFNSKVAIDHFFRIVNDLKIAVPETMKYFCISESVALYLQKYIVYRKRKIFYANNVMDELIVLLAKHKSDKFLVPVSDIHNDDIPNRMVKAKLEYGKAVMYRTVSSDLSDINQEEYDMFIFFSPEGIKSLFHNFPNFEQKDIKIGSFGLSTAQAVKDAGLRLDIQAPLPHLPSMASALEHFIKDAPKSNRK